MGKRLLASLFLFMITLIILGFDLKLFPQFTGEELAERSKWEEFLRRAKIIKAEDVGQGVTKPKRLLLKDGDVEQSAIWKRPSGTDAGIFDKWEAEIAAYRLDKLLGLNMIPPTVERKYRGRSGSLQLWVKLETSELERSRQNILIPEDKREHSERMIFLERAFDSLIANTDRSLQNIHYTPDWRLILVDHSRSFNSNRMFTDQLVYGKYGLRKPLLFENLPRLFVDKVRALTYESIKNAVGPYLTFSEIEGILARKKLLLREIDEMIKEKGENKVLY